MVDSARRLDCQASLVGGLRESCVVADHVTQVVFESDRGCEMDRVERPKPRLWQRSGRAKNSIVDAQELQFAQNLFRGLACWLTVVLDSPKNFGTSQSA